MSQGYDDDFEDGAAQAATDQDGGLGPNLVELNALLGRGTSYSGKLHFDGRVRIEGKFDGEIHGDDVLVIGEGAEVDGTIEVGCCIVTGGVVRANIRAADAIELHAPAVVCGDLHAPNIFIDRGVRFEGNCKMAPLTGRPAPVTRARVKTIAAQPVITAAASLIQQPPRAATENDKPEVAAANDSRTAPATDVEATAPSVAASAVAAGGQQAQARDQRDEYDEYDDYDDEYEDDEYDDEYEYEDDEDDEDDEAVTAKPGDAHLGALEPQPRKRSRRRLSAARHQTRAKRRGRSANED